MENQDKIDELIIEEYLNNWFTYDELSQYLVIPVDYINNLFNIQTLITKVEYAKALKVLEHASNIVNYYSDEPRISSEKDDKIVKIELIAQFIIDNKASIRDTAKHFDMGKTTIHEYMTITLPQINIKLYKQVFDVLMSNKTVGIMNKTIRDQVLMCYELLANGLTCKEILGKLGISRNVLQRNLTYRLKGIDQDKYESANEILNKYKKESQGHIEYIGKGIK